MNENEDFTEDHEEDEGPTPENCTHGGWFSFDTEDCEFCPHGSQRGHDKTLSRRHAKDNEGMESLERRVERKGKRGDHIMRDNEKRIQNSTKLKADILELLRATEMSLDQIGVGVGVVTLTEAIHQLAAEGKIELRTRGWGLKREANRE